jgi:hypothetical protein
VLTNSFKCDIIILTKEQHTKRRSNMEILLLDAKEYSKKNGEEFFKYYNFDMKRYTYKIFDDGWCQVSRLKIDSNGNIYGRIVSIQDDMDFGAPTGLYNNIVVSRRDDEELKNSYKKRIEYKSRYKNAIERRDYAKIDKLNTLTNKETIWDDVRKFTKNVKSDHSIKRWQCLAECRFEELKRVF